MSCRSSADTCVSTVTGMWRSLSTRRTVPSPNPLSKVSQVLRHSDESSSIGM